MNPEFERMRKDGIVNLFSLVINLLTQLIGLIKTLKLQSGKASGPHTHEKKLFSVIATYLTSGI